MKIDLTQTNDVLGAYQAGDFELVRSKYTDPATKYAFTVLDGEQLAGYYIQLAAFRHLRDLQRQGQDDFPFHYSVKDASHILKFAAICPDVDTGEPSELMPWQKFILGQLFGWRDSAGNKRFMRAILSVSRGQGKTYLMAIVLAYSFLVESIGLSNQDYLVSSINFTQTNKLFGYIKTMLAKVSEIEPFKSLAQESGMSIQFSQIIQKANNNVLRMITHNSGKYDSFHFTAAIFDEAGDLPSYDKISAITSGQVKVPNHTFIKISTSYSDPSAPFHDEQKRGVQTMEQDYKREDDQSLYLVWAQDDLAETYKPETWIKSNPLLGLPSQHNVLLNGLENERDSLMLEGKLSDFQTKNLNLWLQEATNSFLKLADIERSVIPNFDIRGRQVYIGFDYSMFSDNTAIAFAYPYMDGAETKWHVEQHSFIPWQKAGSIEAKEKQDGINYREAAKNGYCTITSHPQGLINDDQVYQWLMEYVEDNQLEVVFFGYDAWGATPAIKQLQVNTAWPLIAIRQRTSELKDPTKFLQRTFVESSITRLDDPIMEKALINSQISEDKIGIQVDKAKATLKIDVVDAMVDALYQAMYHFEDYADINDKSKQVDRMTAEQIKAWFESDEAGLLGGGGDDDDF